MPSIHVHIHRQPAKAKDASSIPDLIREYRSINEDLQRGRIKDPKIAASKREYLKTLASKLRAAGAPGWGGSADAKKFVTKRDYRIPDDPIWERRAGGILPSSTVVYEVSPGQYRPWFHKGSGVLRLDPKDLVTE